MNIQDQIIADVEHIEAVLLRIDRVAAGMNHQSIDEAADAALLGLRDLLDLITDVAVERWYIA